VGPTGQPSWDGGSDRVVAFKSGLVSFYPNPELVARLHPAPGRYRSRL
jgi:hypothetical protein